MNMLNELARTAILSGTVLCILLAILALVVSLRSRRRLAAMESRISEVATAVEALAAGAAASSRAGADMRARIAKLTPQVENLGYRVPSVQTFQRAIEMAQQGADASALVSCCGLNRGEAALVISLHGGRSRAA